MIELLQIPVRFPDATEPHIANWQESIIAWWWHPEKHELMITSFGEISPEVINTLRTWIRLKTKHPCKKKANALDEIEAAINTSFIEFNK